MCDKNVAIFFYLWMCGLNWQFSFELVHLQVKPKQRAFTASHICMELDELTNSISISISIRQQDPSIYSEFLILRRGALPKPKQRALAESACCYCCCLSKLTSEVDDNFC